jgi:LysR family transcriptional activator of nhaA
MESLNYNHLFYFWVVAREGGLVAAGRKLRLSHPTLSAQVHALEDRLGEKLFGKIGRRLVLTEMGKMTYRFAEEIFALGGELLDTVAGRGGAKAARLEVGVVDVVPKLVVSRLLKPALTLPEPVRLVCHEDSFDRLLGDLAQHTLDIVIADCPVPSGSAIRAHHHLLGEAGVSLFATPALARAYHSGFPGSLDGAPFLLPAEGLTLRRSLNQWFERQGIRPRIVAEFADSALMKVFGADGVGVFPASASVENDVTAQFGVVRLGLAEGVSERFYAISAERRLKHPAVLAISQTAHHDLFAAAPPKGRRRD